MGGEYHRNNKEYLREYESLTKDDLLLTYLFNSKLSFSEIESNIKNIKVHLERLHERTIQYYAENRKWKNMISKQIINKIKINTRNRL